MQSGDFRSASRRCDLFCNHLGRSLNTSVDTPEASTHMSEDRNVVAGLQSRNVDIDCDDGHENTSTIRNTREIERRRSAPPGDDPHFG